MGALWAPYGRLVFAIAKNQKHQHMVPLRSYGRLVGALWAPCGRLPPKTKLLNNVMRALWAPCGRLVGALCTLHACLMAALWALCVRTVHALVRALVRAPVGALCTQLCFCCCCCVNEINNKCHDWWTLLPRAMTMTCSCTCKSNLAR